MRNASPALIALINGNTEFFVADCLTLVRPDGTVHRFTNAPQDISVESQYDSAVHVFAAAGVTFRRSRVKLVVGTEVDDMDLTLLTEPTRDTVTLGGVARTWPELARLGYLDEAEVMLERAFMTTWADTSAGTLILFSGVLANITADRGNVATKVKAYLALLALPSPRNTYQPGCIHALFDSGCTLLKADFLDSGTADVGSTTHAIVTGLGAADGYYDLGALTITSGPNIGQTRTVKSFLSGVAQLSRPFLFSSVIGETFDVYPGCDKTQDTCDTKFVNLEHFRGYPYVPTPENAK